MPDVAPIHAVKSEQINEDVEMRTKSKLFMLTVAAMLCGAGDAQARPPKAQAKMFPFAIDVPFQEEPVEILNYGSLTLLASCRSNEPVGYDTASLLATSSEGNWRVTGDQPDSFLSAGQEVVVLYGYVLTGTNAYGAPAPIAGQNAGRSIRAASGETIIVLADSVAFLFSDGCTFTGLAYLLKD
jgi:hypothetical protein